MALFVTSRYQNPVVFFEPKLLYRKSVEQARTGVVVKMRVRASVSTRLRPGRVWMSADTNASE